MSAILDGADDIAVHTVTVIAWVVGRDKITVVVSLAVQQAVELATGGQWSGRRGHVFRVTVVADRTADSIHQDG